MARPTGDPYYDALVTHVHARHPHFVEAVLGDARAAARSRNESEAFGGGLLTVARVLRLMWVSDALFAQVLYRAKARLQARGVPALPTLLHRLSIMVSDISIGDLVVVEPGLYIGHGVVVIDGLVEIHEGVRIMPGAVIGLRVGTRGPVIERDVMIGAGAKVLGDITVGRGAKIGANAVVVHDVVPGASMVGVPARPVGDDPDPEPER